MSLPAVWIVMVCFCVGEVTGCSQIKDVPVVTVSKLSKVLVSCPSITADESELKNLLLFNGQLISEVHQSQERGSTQSLFMFEVAANNSGAYVCKKEVMYPPPNRDSCHRTQVIVEGQTSPPPINDTVPLASDSCPDWSPIIAEVVMWAGSGVLLVYSLIITCITIVLWRKLKRDDGDTNVYVNTRPALRKP